MINDQVLLDSFRHYRSIGYSVQTSMVLALDTHAINPSRPENSVALRTLQAGTNCYRYMYTNLQPEDLV